MSVLIRGFSVIVRANSVEARFPGGMAAFETLCPNATFCTDGHLARVAFMTSVDAGMFGTALKTRGLRPGTGGDADMVIVSEAGASGAVGWLESGHVDGRPAAWLSGQDAGPLAGTDLSPLLTFASQEEFQATFEFLDSTGNLDTYRNRETGQLVYVGRVGTQPTRAELTPSQANSHNRLLRWAKRLVKGEIPLHEQPRLPPPGWFAAGKLWCARRLLTQVLALHQANDLAMFLVGMIHTRFEEYDMALTWFDRASAVNPYESNFFREAGRCAMELGRGNAAVRLARRSAQLNPADHGLRANLAIALLTSNRIEEAKAEIDQALSAAPEDGISLAIRRLILHFETTGERPPTTLRELEEFQRYDPPATSASDRS